MPCIAPVINSMIPARIGVISSPIGVNESRNARPKPLKAFFKPPFAISLTLSIAPPTSSYLFPTVVKDSINSALKSSPIVPKAVAALFNFSC